MVVSGMFLPGEQYVFLPNYIESFLSDVREITEGSIYDER
jgi:hypothetical protein